MCDEQFSLEGAKIPRLLNCGHTVCHRCLTRLTLLPNGNLACPFDRQVILEKQLFTSLVYQRNFCQVTQLSDSGVWSLKKNFALVELLEKVQINDDNINLPIVNSVAGASQSISGLGLNFDPARERQV